MGLNQENTQAVESAVAANETGANAFVYPRATKFRFNKDDMGNQRPAVEVNVPVPSFQGIVHILENADKDEAGKKAFQLLLDAVAAPVIQEVRSYVGDNANASQDTIPWDKLTFQAIANMPAAVRGASAIAKELWEKFSKSYVAVMPAKTGASAEVCAARVGVLVQKFRPLTGNPDRKTIITNLMNTLTVFVDSNPPELQDFEPIIDFLIKKAEELKAEDSVVTTEALGF